MANKCRIGGHGNYVVHSTSSVDEQRRLYDYTMNLIKETMARATVRFDSVQNSYQDDPRICKHDSVTVITRRFYGDDMWITCNHCGKRQSAPNSWIVNFDNDPKAYDYFIKHSEVMRARYNDRLQNAILKDREARNKQWAKSREHFDRMQWKYRA